MEPEEFLRKYENECFSSSAFICLETNFRVSSLKPKKSSSFTMHFLPIRGAGTVQNVALIQLLDKKTQKLMDILDPIEVFITE
jgi:hypothetical protein